MNRSGLTNLLAAFLLGAGLLLTLLSLWQQEQTIADNAAVYAELAEMLRTTSEPTNAPDAEEAFDAPDVTLVPPMVIADVVPIGTTTEPTAEPTVQAAVQPTTQPTASGYSRKFAEAHQQDLALHRAAKSAFDALGTKKIPSVKVLKAEYAALAQQKKQAYPAYRQARDDMRMLLRVRANVETILNSEGKDVPAQTAHRAQNNAER